MNAPDSVRPGMLGLSVHDVDSWRAQRIRDHAHAVLARQRRLSRLGRAYNRYLEPALVAGLCALVLLWGVERTLYLIS